MDKEKNRDSKVKELKKQLRSSKSSNQTIRDKIDDLSKCLVDTHKLECELNKLTHWYKRGDIIVLRTNEIATIRNTYNQRHYNVSVECSVLRTGLVTHQKIHQRDIRCHILDLCLENAKEVKHKEKGYRTYGMMDK